MSVELTSLDESHQEVDSKVVLVNVVHTHYERVVYTAKDVLFKFQGVK